MAKVKYKSPKGYHSVTAALCVRGAAEALEFYARAFGAKERMRLMMPDGKIGHAEIEIGDTRVMLSDEFPEHGASPAALGGTTVALTLYVADADAVFARAIEAGAKVKRPVQDQFYGDRSGRIEDPFGHNWSIQQRLEDVSPKKMQKRLDALMAAGGLDPVDEKPAVRQRRKPKAKVEE